MGGASRVVMRQTAASGAMLIGGALLLVPRWGMTGAAVAASAAVVGVNLARLWEVRRRFGILPWSRGLMSPLGAGVAAAAVVWGIRSVFAGAPWPLLAPLCLVLYFGFLPLFGLHRADRELILALVRRLKMGTGSGLEGGQSQGGTVPASAGPHYRER
jgi:O-antigen/teichoic acid export membrane protein